MKETLSDKMCNSDDTYVEPSLDVFLKEDVKQFIKELKVRMCIYCSDEDNPHCACRKRDFKILDELAGDKLIK